MRLTATDQQTNTTNYSKDVGKKISFDDLKHLVNVHSKKYLLKDRKSSRGSNIPMEIFDYGKVRKRRRTRLLLLLTIGRI